MSSFILNLADYVLYLRGCFLRSKCGFKMVASILLVRVTRGALDDNDDDGLDRMATIPLLPNVKKSLRRSL